jgi:hypothetical protein
VATLATVYAVGGDEGAARKARWLRTSRWPVRCR